MIDYDYSIALGEERLKDFKKAGADILVTSCPLCKSQFHDLSKRESKGMIIQSVIEVLRQSLDRS